MSRENDNRREIGGYFGLEMPDYPNPFLDCLKYQSGRAAVRAIIAGAKFELVYVPNYICDSVVHAAEEAGAEIRFYSLDWELMPADLPSEIGPRSGLIYVNYFGLSQRNITRILSRYPAGQVLVDQSHALFAERTAALAEIYSPRKFVGLPDGGLLRTWIPIEAPEQEDEGSFARTAHLFKRFAYSARAGYEDFNCARLSLADTTPKRMSLLTEQLMSTIDWKYVRDRRRGNFDQMAALLSKYNDWPSKNDKDVEGAPLCYPFVAKSRDMTVLKSVLADEYDVFTPTYWPEVAARVTRGSAEEMLIRETLFLPIDQRMDAKDVKNVSIIVLNLLNE